MLIPGSCHCGNISFTLDWTPEPTEIPARACGCSFCSKHGGVWTSCPTGSLKITIKQPAQVGSYFFGTRTAEFRICSVCGVVPVVTCMLDGQLFAVVNVNAFEAVEPSLLKRVAASFDNGSEATRLARRKRNWIGRVELVQGSGEGVL